MPSLRRHPDCASIGLTVAGALLASFAAAQEAPPVGVRFSYADATVIGLYPGANERAAAEADVTSRLAAFFEENLAYWPVRATDGLFPRLDVHLRKDGSRRYVLVELLPVNGQPATYAEQVTVYEAGDISGMGGLPPRDRIPGRIVDKIAEFYRTAAHDALRDRLVEGAPLGAAAHVVSSTTGCVAVLPLKWERYCSLATSNFSLEYERADQSRVTVFGAGLGQPAEFTLAVPQFTGLKIRPRKWVSDQGEEDVSQHLGDFGQLRPRLFRLKQLNADPSTCLSVAGAPPSVAH
jgi:hypothetical protein